MKVYIPHKAYEFRYPEDMKRIMQYLKEHGEVRVSPKTIEGLYEDFSDTRCAGWLGANEETLEAFAEYLADIEL